MGWMVRGKMQPNRIPRSLQVYGKVGEGSTRRMEGRREKGGYGLRRRFIDEERLVHPSIGRRRQAAGPGASSKCWMSGWSAVLRRMRRVLKAASGKLDCFPGTDAGAGGWELCLRRAGRVARSEVWTPPPPLLWAQRIFFVGLREVAGGKFGRVNDLAASIPAYWT